MPKSKKPKGTKRAQRASAKDLPVKSGGAVKGGITFEYGKLGVKYTPQQNAGSA